MLGTKVVSFAKAVCTQLLSISLAPVFILKHVFSSFQTVSYYIAQAEFKFTILLLYLHKCRSLSWCLVALVGHARRDKTVDCVSGM